MTRVPRASTAAWNGFLDRIAKARSHLGCEGLIETGVTGNDTWYRGVTDREHSLLPSLFRKFADPNETDWYKIWAVEADLFWEFSARAASLHGSLRSDWDYLFSMQHFRTPTRLLDWTEVLGIAVYFALLKHDPQKPNPPIPRVWVLNPYALNRATTENSDADLYAPNYLTEFDYSDQLMEEGIGFEEPIAIYPRQTNARLHSQRAWFTIHGNDFRPMESMGFKKVLEPVDLPIEAIPAARQFLEIAGINHYLLFGDLENLSRHLCEKNGL